VDNYLQISCLNAFCFVTSTFSTRLPMSHTEDPRAAIDAADAAAKICDKAEEMAEFWAPNHQPDALRLAAQQLLAQADRLSPETPPSPPLVGEGAGGEGKWVQRPIHPNAFIGPELSDSDLRLISETAGYCDASAHFDGMTIPFAKRAVSDVRHLVAQVRRLQRDKAALQDALEVEKAKTALLWPVATKQTPAHDAQ
jgi:hypothetical protein